MPSPHNERTPHLGLLTTKNDHVKLLFRKELLKVKTSLVSTLLPVCLVCQPANPKYCSTLLEEMYRRDMKFWFLKEKNNSLCQHIGVVAPIVETYIPQKFRQLEVTCKEYTSKSQKLELRSTKQRCESQKTNK